MRRALALAGLAAGLVLVSGGAASAHPLGNFTVNHYNGISLYPERVEVRAIVDIAEIPTAQELPAVDTDGSGTPSAEELAAYAPTQCADVAAAVVVEVDGAALRWTVGDASAQTVPGVADLPTLRLSCLLSSAADLDGPATVSLTDTYREDRVGWHEITAVGDGVRLLDPTVAGESVTDELRNYPDDLLQSPLDQRSVELRVEPGSGLSSGSDELLEGASADPFTRFIAAADRYLEELIGPELTPLVGILAVLLAVLLGAGHALLPGHGKTVMAAYLAGRRGSRRDAVMVGATVTVTHTIGVLVLGLLISASSAIAGEQVLRWLGVVSGLLVAAIGAALLRSALRSRRSTVPIDEPVPALVGAPAAGGAGGSVAAPVHDHASVPDPAHPHDHDHGAPAHSDDHSDDHSHGHDHDHSQRHDHAHDGAEHSHDHEGAPDHDHGAPAHSHGFGRAHSHGGHSHSHGYSKGGLIGMGIAGGLVPSPSALVVLLASIALGRTVFGVVLVFAYGFGMAATLTAVGLLLVRLRGRLAQTGQRASLRQGAARISAALPVVTALLVLVVGLALATRGVLSPV